MMAWYAFAVACISLAVSVGLLFRVHSMQTQIGLLQLHKWIADDQRLAEIQKKGTTLQ